MDELGAIGSSVQAGGGLIALGLIVWLVKRVFSHTIPRMSKDFKEALACQQAMFSDEMKVLREAFAEEIKSQRQDFRDELHMQRQDFREELGRERQRGAA